MRHTLILKLLLVLMPCYTFGQFKLAAYGGVGLGIEPRNDYKLIMKGNLMLTTYPEIPYPLTQYTEFRFKVGNGWPGCEFGTPSRKIAVWSSEVGYNDLYAAHYYLLSDSTSKTNIIEVDTALSILRQIKSYSYQLKYDTIVENKITYGFLAQELVNIIPNLIDTGKELLLVDYHQVTPLIVRAINEQQNIIDSLLNSNSEQRKNKQDELEEEIELLFNEIEDLRNTLEHCCEKRSINQEKKHTTSKSILFQNKPNPFNENTIIEYYLEEETTDAYIAVFDLQGKLIKQYKLLKAGKGNITINKMDIEPGKYFYSLIIHSIEIDTKKMILLN